MIFGWLGPLIINLHQDSLDKSSPVLRLIITWSETDTCQFLLFKKIEDKPILSHLIGLLKADLVSREVSMSVMKLVSNLFQSEKIDAEEQKSNEMEVEDTEDEIEKKKCLKLIIPDLIGFFTAIMSKKSARGLDKDILQLIVYISVDLDSEKLCEELSGIILAQLKSKNTFLRIEILKALTQLLIKTPERNLTGVCSDLINICQTIGDNLNWRAQLVECFGTLAKVINKTF